MKTVLPRSTWLVPLPFVLTALLSLACDDGGGTSSATEVHNDSSSTGGEVGTSASSPTESVTSGSTTGGSSPTESVTSGSPDDSSSAGSSGESSAQTTGSSGEDPASTGGSDQETIEEACQTMCETAVVVCDIGFPVGIKSCVSLCLYSFGEDVGACGEAAIDYVDCMATLECDPLLAALTDGEPGACVDAGNAYNNVCP